MTSEGKHDYDIINLFVHLTAHFILILSSIRTHEYFSELSYNQNKYVLNGF